MTESTQDRGSRARNIDTSARATWQDSQDFPIGIFTYFVAAPSGINAYFPSTRNEHNCGSQLYPQSVNLKVRAWKNFPLIGLIISAHIFSLFIQLSCGFSIKLVPFELKAATKEV